MPASSDKRVRVLVFVESPIQVQGSHTPHSKAFPFIRPIAPAGDFTPPAGGNHLDFVAKSMQSEGQLSSDLLRPANIERGKQ